MILKHAGEWRIAALGAALMQPEIFRILYIMPKGAKKSKILYILHKNQEKNSVNHTK